MPLPDFDALWDFDHPDQSEVAFTTLLPEAEAGGDPGYLAELLTQIARARGLQRRFAEADAALDRAATLIGDEMPRPRVRLFLERGRVRNSAGRPSEARPCFEDAWELARAHSEDMLAVDAAHMLAIVAADPEEQRAWNGRALEIAERSDLPRAVRWRASLYNNLGWTEHDAGHYDAALALFERALAVRLELGEPENIRVARWCVARCLRSLGRSDDALRGQEALLAESRQTAEEDGFIFEELGECLLALGRDAEARPWLARAYAVLARDPWLAEREPARLDRLRQLGNTGDAADSPPSAE
jgi:tetratricopeptide (TPR) repeat protein